MMQKNVAPRKTKECTEKSSHQASSELEDIFAVDRNLRETMSSKPQRAGQGARQRTVRTSDFEETVLDCVAETPSVSIRQIVHGMHASKNTMWRLLREVRYYSTALDEPLKELNSGFKIIWPHYLHQ
ncbi:hypothetical protein ANN_18594 [Periplaneta americana]|uniref:Uncharacterized protein n=1 Tax=Periplaneta americana TaxID=6978 RepID=A0ABQ8SP69_PERAM|nr:hypothetical protein ANN_18594 [Periplaneta americana]